MDQRLQAFFREYEAANLASDVSRIGKLYADWFMFAGPMGVQVVKKEDFLRVVPKMKTHFASLGVHETRLESVEVSALNSRYALAKVSWRILLSSSAADENFVDVSATYVLDCESQQGMAIVLQIDDQDLATAIKDRQSKTGGE
jgi:hypothetical protein